MANWKLNALRGERRREFLKMMGLAAAGLGLERAQLLNHLVDVGGHRLAEAAVNQANRCVLVTGGSGVYAWFQELWPHPYLGVMHDQSDGNTNNGLDNHAYLYRANFGYTGTPGLDYQGGARPFYYGPHAPFVDFVEGAPTRPMTAIMSGKEETHTPTPVSPNLVNGSATMSAAIGAIQAATSTTAIIPAIGLDPVDFGDAAGAPDIVTVPSADGMVGLFNSAASQYVLESAKHRQLFETYYNALVGLRGAAPRSTWVPQLTVAKGAAKLIGLNFAAALTPTEQDQANYGITALAGETVISDAQREGLDAFGRKLMVTARAFRLGLTNMAMIALAPSTGSNTFRDPHAVFNDNTRTEEARNCTMYLGMMLQAFYDELAQYDDPDFGGSMKLDQTTVFACYGDTPHSPLSAVAWADATPDSANWIYLMSQGYIHDGWFGQIKGIKSAPEVYGFDPVTGEEILGKSAQETNLAASAAVLYSVARGDWNTVAEHYPGAKIEAMLKT